MRSKSNLRRLISAQMREVETKGAELRGKFSGYPHIQKWIDLWILLTPEPSGIDFLRGLDLNDSACNLRQLDDNLKMFVFDVLPPL